MTGDYSITVTLLLALVTLGCTLYNTFRGKNKDTEETVEHRISEATKRAEENAKINIKLDGISQDIRFVREDNVVIKKQVQEHDKQIALLEASIRSAHKRMDGAGIGSHEYEHERKE